VWPDFDGTKTRAYFRSLGDSEDDAFRKAMPDFHQEDVAVSVQGNEITVLRTLCGTLSDGTHLRVPIHGIYAVVGEEIVRIEPHIGDTDLEAIRQALRVGGEPADFVPQTP
jgi:hypothetical protein